jgi:serine/threonine protein kinase
MERNELISRTNSSADSVLWVLNQCTGLAGALDKVHEGLNKPNSQSKSKDEPSKQTRTGHLHDIKLENILVFREHGSGNEITLKLADFSCARIKEFVHRGLANLDGSGTPSYRAPEFDLPVADRRLGLPYDVWSLGAVFLELITWFLNGRNGVEEFGLDRYA